MFYAIEMNKTNKAELYQKFEKFKLEDDIGKKEVLKTEIEAVLLAALDNHLTAEDYFVWGLLYYFSSEDQAGTLKVAQDKFRQALKLDKAYLMARLYLGHCLQDEHNFREALKEYEQVNGTQLKQEYPVWRYVKLREQIGYCYYQLGDKDKAEAYFQEVLQHYRTLPYEETAVPSEMMQCLPEQHPIALAMRRMEEQ
jgi:tetratricopeptide (TPR) repeat protein